MQKQHFLTDTIEEFQTSDASSDELSLTNMDGSQPVIYEQDQIQREIDMLEAELTNKQQHNAEMQDFQADSPLCQQRRACATGNSPFLPNLSETEQNLRASGPNGSSGSQLSAHAHQVLHCLNSNGISPRVISDGQLMDYLANYMIEEQTQPDELAQFAALQQQIDAVSELNQELLQFEQNLKNALSSTNYYLYTELIRKEFGIYPFAEANSARLRCLIRGEQTGGDLTVQQGRRALSMATSRLYSNEMRVEKFMEFFAVMQEVMDAEE